MSDSNGLVIVVGSINVDVVVRVDRLPAPGETIAGGELERHGGGKGANQAVAAARAGARVHMIGAVGDDDFGRAATDELTDEGIDCSGVAVLGGAATGVAAITVDDAGENQIAVASGANRALGAEQVTQALSALSPGADAVLLMNFELEDEPLAAAAQWAVRERLAHVILNPAPARQLADALLAPHPVLTPNAGELRALIDGPTDAAAVKLAEITGGPVIVTLGAEGALVAPGGGKSPRRIPAPEVRAVDTTGAGDAFNGALATALAQGCELHDAVTRAVAAASASVQGRGARGGMPNQTDMGSQ